MVRAAFDISFNRADFFLAVPSKLTIAEIAELPNRKLQKYNLFTKLAVEDCRVKLKHGLTKDTLAEVRSQFCIIYI